MPVHGPLPNYRALHFIEVAAPCLHGIRAEVGVRIYELPTELSSMSSFSES